MLFLTIIVIVLGISALYMSFILEWTLIPVIMSFIAITIKVRLARNEYKNIFLTIGSYASSIALGICIIHIIAFTLTDLSMLFR